MKTIFKPTFTAILGAGLFVFTSTCVAQDAKPNTAERPQGSQPNAAERTQEAQPNAAGRTQGSQPNAAGRVQGANRTAGQDDQTSGTNLRLSQLLNMSIKNRENKDVGKINDMVIDASEHKIHYVVVTYGGFLGIGSEMHAVPYEAFQLKSEQDDPASTVLVLNVSQEQMEGAQGFDKNNWPNFADEEFTRSTNQRYEVQRTQGSDRQGARSETQGAAGNRDAATRRNQQDGANRPGTQQGQPDGQGTRSETQGAAGNRDAATRRNQQGDTARTGKQDGKSDGMHLRASKLIGKSIQNSEKENVGSIDDIVVNARNGQLRYAAVSYGGFLGIGDDLHAVPIEAIQCNTAPNDASDSVLTLNVTKEQMKGAKGFNKSNWPNFADEDFTREADQRHGIDQQRSGTSLDVNRDRTGRNAQDRDQKRTNPQGRDQRDQTGTTPQERDHRDQTGANARERDNTGVNKRDRDGTAKTSFDQKQNQSDINITANIRKRVVATKMSTNAQNVKIITQDGKVTLRGPVKNAEEKAAIDKLAKEVAGAENVVNQLEVQP